MYRYIIVSNNVNHVKVSYNIIRYKSNTSKNIEEINNIDDDSISKNELRKKYSNDIGYKNRMAQPTSYLQRSFRARGGISVTDRLSQLLPEENSEENNNNYSQLQNKTSPKFNGYCDYSKARPFEEGELIHATFQNKKLRYCLIYIMIYKKIFVVVIVFKNISRYYINFINAK